MTTFDPVPMRVEEVLDPAWLTHALNDLGDGEKVVETVRVDSSQTIAAKVRFEAVIAGSDGQHHRRPYCVKGNFDGDGTGFLIETRVYRDLTPVLDVRTPKAYYTGIDEATGQALVIMDDVVANGGEFLDAHTPYSLETTRETLAQLARVHAATWGEERLAPFGWLQPARVASIADTMPTELLQSLVDDGRGPGLPPHLRDAEKVKAAMRLVAATQRVCVVHGDAHSGNVYRDRDGRPCWLDWQITHIGHWATDVSYHIATVLDIDMRRAHEESLLRGYLDELGRLGVEPPAWPDAWDQYTRHIAYGYFLWCITRISSRAVVLEHIPRLGTALVDHDVFGRLGV